MNEIDNMLKEYQQLAGKDDAQSLKRKEEILKWMENNPSEEQKVKGQAWLSERLAEMQADVTDIRKQVLRSQMDERIYKLTPWSYIAREYFGKSVSWLTQRINGYPVRGKTYTLSKEQKQTLNRALSEVGTLIGSYRFA